ncbi:hypothetical protein QYF36_000419 [Acer negundo]|nr:hypothetical protein QYF36_000419 [Acer negundo]
MRINIDLVSLATLPLEEPQNIPQTLMESLHSCNRGTPTTFNETQLISISSTDEDDVDEEVNTGSKVGRELLHELQMSQPLTSNAPLFSTVNASQPTQRTADPGISHENKQQATTVATGQNQAQNKQHQKQKHHNQTSHKREENKPEQSTAPENKNPPRNLTKKPPPKIKYVKGWPAAAAAKYSNSRCSYSGVKPSYPCHAGGSSVPGSGH